MWNVCMTYICVCVWHTYACVYTPMYVQRPKKCIGKLPVSLSALLLQSRISSRIWNFSFSATLIQVSSSPFPFSASHHSGLTHVQPCLNCHAGGKDLNSGRHTCALSVHINWSVSSLYVLPCSFLPHKHQLPHAWWHVDHISYVGPHQDPFLINIYLTAASCCMSVSLKIFYLLNKKLVNRMTVILFDTKA